MISQALRQLKIDLGGGAGSALATEIAKLVTVASPTGMTDFSAAASGGTLDIPAANDIYTAQMPLSSLWSARSAVVFEDATEANPEQYGGQSSAPTDYRIAVTVLCTAIDTDSEQAAERARRLAQACRHVFLTTSQRDGVLPNTGHLYAVSVESASHGLLDASATGFMHGSRFVLVGTERQTASITTYNPA